LTKWGDKVCIMKNMFLIEISPKILADNTSVLQEIHSLGIKKINNIEIKKIYSLVGNMDENQIVFITEALLADIVAESYRVMTSKDFKNLNLSNNTIVNIWYKPQVLDVESIYVVKGIKYLGFKEELEVHSGKQIVFSPKVDKKTVSFIIEKIFMNPLIQYYEII